MSNGVTFLFQTRVTTEDVVPVSSRGKLDDNEKQVCVKESQENLGRTGVLGKDLLIKLNTYFAVMAQTSSVLLLHTLSVGPVFPLS